MRDKLPVTAYGDYVPEGVEIPWTKLSAGAVAQLWVEAVDPSGGLADITIKTRVKEGDPEVDDEIRMTSVRITCEPITAEPQSGLYPYNPAGVVGGEDAKFKIDVEPAEFPDAEINWKTEMWAALTPLPKTGTTRFVEFRHGQYAGGAGNIRAEVTGNYYPHPGFPVRVFPYWSVVPMNVFIAHDASGSPALPPGALASVVDPVNEIFKQAGMHFDPVIRPWSSNAGNGENYYNIPDEVKGAEALSKCPISSGVRVVFVNSLPGPSGGSHIAGWHFPGQGILCRTDVYSGVDLAKILAHELGHACGLEDIYVNKNDTDGGSPAYLEIDHRAKAVRSWSHADWPENGYLNCDPVYYSRFGSGTYVSSTAPDSYSTRQANLIRRLFMHGYVNPDNYDIPIGMIYGVRAGYGPQWPLTTGDANVGIVGMNRNPSHN